MSVADFFQRLQDLGLPTQIRESGWLFPTIETVHVFALVLVVGSIMTVDLRLLGLGNRQRPASELLAEMLPWTWTAFAVAALAGALLFASRAATYYANLPFQLKMASLLLAATNMTVFHLQGMRRITDWDRGTPPLAARLAGGISLVLWAAIVAAGRWIGFTT